MESFAEFLVSFLAKIGVFYVFAIIIVAVLTFPAFLFIFKSANLNLNDIQQKILALLAAISSALLVGYTYRNALLVQYFISLVSITLLIIFFIILIISFVSGEVKRPSSINTIAYAAIILLVIFAFIALYYAYQDLFITLNLGGTEGGEYAIFRSTWRADVLAIPFIFMFLGLAVYILGREQ